LENSEQLFMLKQWELMKEDCEIIVGAPSGLLTLHIVKRVKGVRV